MERKSDRQTDEGVPVKRDDKSPDQLRHEYMTLLDECHSEQTYQNFIEHNTRLLPREFVQNHGVHLRLVLRKLAFGADYKCDFAYLSKSSDNWHCVLVELERPSSRFFQSASNSFHSDFVKALQQINKWRAWFLNPGNMSGFVDGILRPIRRPLPQNPTHVKYVLVSGRRAEYAENDERRRMIAAQEGPDLKIMTFDSLCENLDAKHDLHIGSRRNEYIDILSDLFLTEDVFVWVEPEQLRISLQFKETALQARSRWHWRTTVKGKFALGMDSALSSIRIRGSGR